MTTDPLPSSAETVLSPAPPAPTPAHRGPGRPPKAKPVQVTAQPQDDRVTKLETTVAHMEKRQGDFESFVNGVFDSITPAAFKQKHNQPGILDEIAKWFSPAN